MRVRAHLNTCGLTAGHEYDVDAGHPGLRAAIAAGWVEDLTPPPAVRSPRRTQPPAQPVVAETSGSGSGDGSGEGSGD